MLKWASRWVGCWHPPTDTVEVIISLVRQGMAMLKLYPLHAVQGARDFLVAIGVIYAGVFPLSQTVASSGPGYGGEVGNQIFGGIMLIASRLGGSLNFALAGMLGEM